MKRFLFVLLAGISVPWVASAAAAQAPAARREVLIEAVIVEVPPTRSRPVSGRLSGGSDPCCGLGILTGTNAGCPNSRVLLGSTNRPNGQSGGFGYVTQLGDDLGFIINAHTKDSRFKILQRPRLHTSEGEPASVFIGQSRPYPAGACGADRSAAVKQIQIGMTLEVNPVSLSKELVVLDIRLRIDRFDRNVSIKGVGEVPVTSSTESQARIAVADRQTILLGGMPGWNRQSTTRVLQFPKDLPGVAAPRLAGQSGRSELMVLVRPTLLAGRGEKKG